MKFKSVVFAVAVIFCSYFSALSIPETYASEEEKNIVISSDFENGDTDKWSVFGGRNITADNNASHSGESSLKVTDRGDITVVHTDEYSNTGSHSIYVTNRTAVWNGPTLLISNKVRKNESYYYSADVMYNGREYEDSHIFRLEIQYNLNGSDVYQLIGEKEAKKNK